MTPDEMNAKLRQIAQRYVNCPNTEMTRQALRAEITTQLLEWQELGYLDLPRFPEVDVRYAGNQHWLVELL